MPRPGIRQPGTMMMEVEVTAVPAPAALPHPLGGLVQCGFGFVWLEVRADFGRATLKPKRIYGFYLMTKLSLRR